MNRTEFMKELEYLLQDIAEEEKADALDYYHDYLEEAGDEQEAEVLSEFGSPERIAAMIRSDLHGGMVNGGEFTDQGFQDSRFEDPRYRLANRLDLPEGQKSGSFAGTKDKKTSASNQGQSRNGVKIILLILLGCLLSPVLLGLGGTAFGLIAAVIGVLIAFAVSIAAITFALFAAAIALIVCGIVNLFSIAPQGLLILGIGMAILGVSFFSLILAILFYGRLLPALIRGVVNLCNRLFHRKGKASV